MVELTKKIIFDTDCLCSFLWVGREDIVLNLYNGLIVIPDQVHAEIERVSFLANKLERLISDGKVTTQSIFSNTVEYRLYNEMTSRPTLTNKRIGRGEASAIALCITQNGILVSNNLQDIMIYVEHFNLDLLTTADIMKKAYILGLITEDEGNNIWTQMINRRRRLPYDSFTECLQNN